MTRKLCPGEGRGPSREIASTQLGGDGLPPAQEYADFSTMVRKLAGLVPATIGWTPDHFWNATPFELAAIFAVFAENERGRLGQAPLGPTQFEKLKETFPDG